jgi:hypothetical protein
VYAGKDIVYGDKHPGEQTSSRIMPEHCDHFENDKYKKSVCGNWNFLLVFQK